jgi:hypothetical protein
MLTLPLSRACPEPCNKVPFSAFTTPLYLAFRGGWQDLAYGENYKNLDVSVPQSKVITIIKPSS